MKYLEGLELNPPASSEDIRRIPDVDQLPPDYVQFMRLANGAEGSIGRTYLAVFSIDELLKRNERLDVKTRAPSLLLFGSDRGSRMYCFDRREQKTRISAIHMADIGIEEPRYRSDSFSGFLEFLALSNDPWS